MDYLLSFCCFTSGCHHGKFCGVSVAQSRWNCHGAFRGCLRGEALVGEGAFPDNAGTEALNIDSEMTVSGVEARRPDVYAILINLDERFRHVDHELYPFNLTFLTVCRGWLILALGLVTTLPGLLDLYTERLGADRCPDHLDNAVGHIVQKLFASDSDGADCNSQMRIKLKLAMIFDWLTVTPYKPTRFGIT